MSGVRPCDIARVSEPGDVPGCIACISLPWFFPGSIPGAFAVKVVSFPQCSTAPERVLKFIVWDKAPEDTVHAVHIGVQLK